MAAPLNAINVRKITNNSPSHSANQDSVKSIIPQVCRLPIGIERFSVIREGGYCYVDKTSSIEWLVKQSKYCFLSRPRGFGKSVLLDTLGCLFEGQQNLFEGLYIHSRWDWQAKHPVVRLSFASRQVASRAGLEGLIREQLHCNRQAFGLALDRDSDLVAEFQDLISQAHQTSGQRVVLLIDDYDKPMLDNLLEPARARDLLDGLNNFYSMIKECDAHLHLVMMAGLSSFKKSSGFAGLDMLLDITLAPECQTMCGYTDNDLDRVFAPELSGLDRVAIRQWYGGYRWGASKLTPVYNPLDVLGLLHNRRFECYSLSRSRGDCLLDKTGSETNTRAFLVDLLKRRGVLTAPTEPWFTTETLLRQFEADDMSVDALLFQTGFVTITDVEEPIVGRRFYTVDFLNQEAKRLLNEALMASEPPRTTA